MIAVFGPALVFADSKKCEQKPTVEIVSKAIKENRILYRLTTLDEFKQIVGQPAKDTTKTEGGMEVCCIEYPDVRAWFGKMKNKPVPFTILWIASERRDFDIGQNRQVVLRDSNDLDKIDSFWGFANVSLANLDLRAYKGLIEEMPFDSLTKWPEPNKLPQGFDPARLLEEGKTPGLGVRDLHKQGIDGRGVTIAILDQPLLKNHQEYTGKIAKYVGISIEGMAPKMHSAPIVSIAVGEHCGVAPSAKVHYYAMRGTSMPDNKIYCDIIEGIMRSNANAATSERIRVVSISTGMFAHQANFDLWKKTLARAEQNGILVVTCDPAFLRYGTLTRIPGHDPDKPSSYLRGRYGDSVLLIPAGNRTIASHRGPDVYTYDRTGGMSWAAPYMAGLAALAYQVKPQIDPKTIVNLWLKTATQTDAGPIVNPVDFIEAVQILK